MNLSYLPIEGVHLCSTIDFNHKSCFWKPSHFTHKVLYKLFGEQSKSLEFEIVQTCSRIQYLLLHGWTFQKIRKQQK
jgi:hypothetical protein